MIVLGVAKLKKILPESEISLDIKQKKKRFCGNFGSIPKLRSTRKGKKYFCDEPASVSLFSLVFHTSKLLEFKNLIKQLFHSRLLDMRLVIAN